ncbi:hypothetical protein LUZ60_012779 [Juncus effusus]|nr:hypothetical protein LUZ60_012779 [Juncus effusus]
MGVGFLEAMIIILNTCTKHMSRAARSLSVSPRKKKENKSDLVESEDFDGQDGVWRRSILMGEKCQPLDFSGVIYYDAEGKKLDNVPPRSPLRSPLRINFAQHLTVS